MAKPEWGTKRTCGGCGARFYDLRKEPIICPVCNTAFDPERQPKLRRPGPALKEEPVLAPHLADNDVVEDDAIESDAVEVDDLEDAAEGGSGSDDLANENEELMEDTSELGEDDDDIGEVMEHVDDELDDKP